MHVVAGHIPGNPNCRLLLQLAQREIPRQCSSARGAHRRRNAWRFARLDSKEARGYSLFRRRPAARRSGSDCGWVYEYLIELQYETE